MSATVSALPEGLREKLAVLLAQSFRYVCIGVDAEGLMQEVWGNPGHLGLVLGRRGDLLADSLPVVVGLDLDNPATITDLGINEQVSVDLHVLPGDPTWLVLVDRSMEVAARGAAQQAANETRLVNADQRRLMDQLIDSRAELALREQQATEASRQKSRFIASMAHEFRTPLTSVLGYAELLTGQLTDNPEGRSQLAAIERSARHLLSLVENNLDQARLEAGSVVIQPVDARMRDMVDDLTVIMAPLAADKGLSFAAYVGAEVPEALWIDDVRLRQVLVNLLSNAIKFTDEGSVYLHVNWREGWLDCEVHDTGPGIPEHAQARIFEAFARLEQTGLKPGAGLGLNISMRLAQLMGGELVLDSRPGKGSAFIVRVPGRPGRAKERETTRQSPERALRERAAAPVSLLVAEDNPDIMQLLDAFLVPAGYRLIKTDNGRDAVRRTLAEQPRLVILDMNLPGLDGMTAVRDIRGAGFAGGILALTATRGTEHRQAALAAGFDEFMSKPVQMTHLLSTLERLLEYER